MPSNVARKSTRKAGGRKGPAKKRVPKTRSLSASHKKALATGRMRSSAVDRYILALDQPKKRGRKVSVATMRTRLDRAKAEKKNVGGVKLLTLSQHIRNLERDIIVAQANGVIADLPKLEAEFIKVAKPFSEDRNVSYGAWRDVGVPAEVLKKAGILRTRG